MDLVSVTWMQAVGQLHHRRRIDRLGDEPVLDLLRRIRRVAQRKPNEPQDLIFVQEGDVFRAHARHSPRKVSSAECALRSRASASFRKTTGRTVDQGLWAE